MISARDMNVELVGHTNSANTNAHDLAELSRQRGGYLSVVLAT